MSHETSVRRYFGDAQHMTFETEVVTPGRRVLQGPAFATLEAAAAHAEDHAQDGAWSIRWVIP